MASSLASVAVVLFAGLCSADVIVVHPTLGVGDFLDVQPAVDAAVDGDVVLVKDGVYPGFHVDGKAIVVCAEFPGHAYVNFIEVRNVAAGSTCVLFGLGTLSAYPVGLRVENVQGLLSVERCEFRGNDGVWTCLAPGQGADVRTSNVVFVDSLVQAGGGCYCTYGCWTDGVDGLQADQSSIAFYSTVIKGGDAAGSDDCHEYAHGGVAVAAQSSHLYFSACEVRAGGGNFGANPLSLWSSQVEWVGSIFFSGWHYHCLSSGSGVEVVPCTAAAGCAEVPGPPRALVSESPYGGLLHEAEATKFVASGAPGDLAFGAIFFDAALAWLPSSAGPMCASSPFSLLVLGPLPATGQLKYTVIVAPLGAPEVTLTVQGGFLASSGLVYFGPPVAAILLDPAY
jgi:hypothetical protein